MLIRGTGGGAGSVFIKLYVLAFFIFLAVPLLAAGMFAFNGFPVSDITVARLYAGLVLQ